jgi:predicted Rossmann fold flavoprotein
MGISCKTEEGGKIYPASDQASSVLDVMRYELEQLGIPEMCEHGVKSIHPNKKGFNVTLRDGEVMKCDRVILATGGKASPNLGSNGSGYNLVTPFGHRLVDTFPALVQLRLDESFLKSVKGVKFMGAASVGVDERVIREEWGELLFTDYGISGIPILQVSRFVAKAIDRGEKVVLLLDYLPAKPKDELLEMLKLRIRQNPAKSIEEMMVGLLNHKLSYIIINEAKLDPYKVSGNISDQELGKLIGSIKEFRMTITDTNSFDNAQVCAGGVSTAEIIDTTMESRVRKGLYFTGELVDVDGTCGGYNLQWAWSSGYLAGISAAGQ